jgi:hypothetical protein
MRNILVDAMCSTKKASNTLQRCVTRACVQSCGAETQWLLAAAHQGRARGNGRACAQRAVHRREYRPECAVADELV